MPIRAHARELWAAGPDYKVSFHDGFAFHPVLGAEADPALLRWRAVSVRAGGRELLIWAASVGAALRLAAAATISLHHSAEHS